MWAEFVHVLQHVKHTIMDLFCEKSHIMRILIFIFENLLLLPGGRCVGLTILPP